MLPSDFLYGTARGLIGINLAVGNELLGCAQSFSAVCNKTFQDDIHFLSTTQCYEWLKSSKKWEEILEPEPKCVIVSVTSMIPKGSPLKNGHIGIVGKLTANDGSLYVMSNDSFREYWNTQFTLKKWEDYYQKYGSIPTFYFRRKIV